MAAAQSGIYNNLHFLHAFGVAAWPEENGNVAFVFEDVYRAEINLNFGIVARETIMAATQLDANSKYLVDFYFNWKGFMNDVKLNAYKIELNATGGLLVVIAKTFRVVEN